MFLAKSHILVRTLNTRFSSVPLPAKFRWLPLSLLTSGPLLDTVHTNQGGLIAPPNCIILCLSVFHQFNERDRRQRPARSLLPRDPRRDRGRIAWAAAWA